MTATWLQEAADRFWLDADGASEFPRNIEKAVVYALPLGIVLLPQLWISDLVYWMEQRKLQCPFQGNDRPLRGCLVAYSGRGLVIISGQDSEDERRFTVAHEVAHFILDYILVRKRIVESLGSDVLEVLDGIRPATFEERINAVVSDASIGVHVHAMDRTKDGDIFQGSVLKAEDNADLLALELLAPSREIYSRLPIKAGGSFREVMNHATQFLKNDFGLPDSVAKLYAYHLVDKLTYGSSIREWLGLDR